MPFNALVTCLACTLRPLPVCAHGTVKVRSWSDNGWMDTGSKAGQLEQHKEGLTRTGQDTDSCGHTQIEPDQTKIKEVDV